MNDNVKINVSKYNDEATNIPCIKENYFTSDLVERLSDYRGAITKLRIPVSEMPVFKSDTSDLKVYLGDWRTGGDSFVSKAITQQPEGFKTLEDMRIAVDDAFSDCYYDLNVDSSDAGVELTSTFTDVRFTGTHESNQTFPSWVNTDAHTRIGGVKLDIKIVQNSGNDTLYTHPLKCYLKHVQAGVTYTTKLFDYIWNSESDTVHFDLSDGNFDFMESGDVYKSGDTLIKCKPLEAFVLQNNIDARNAGSGTQNWGIYLGTDCYPKADFDLLVSATLKVAIFDTDRAGLTMIRPSAPPTLSKDEQTGILSINYQESYHYNNMIIGFSPRLNALLGFNTKYDKPTETFHLKYEPTLFSNERVAIVVQKQEHATVERWTDIVKLEIVSNSLQTDPEANDDGTSSDVITAFSPVFTESPSIFVFDQVGGGPPWRTYSLLNSTPLSKIDISVYVRRKDKNREVLMLAPSEYFQCNLLLVKKD
jgi:hypothetical protein